MKRFVVEVKVSYSVEVTAEEIRKVGLRASKANARYVAAQKVNPAEHQSFETTTFLIDEYDDQP